MNQFVDDTCVYVRCSNIEEATAMGSHYNKKWSNEHRLTLNISKIMVMDFGRARRTQNINKPVIFIDGTALEVIELQVCGYNASQLPYI